MTIIPVTGTEPTSQYSADDPCGLDDMPDFLRRTPGKIKRQPRPRKVWHVTPAMKDAAQKDQARREKIAARPVVLRAIEDGADTFGQVLLPDFASVVVYVVMAVVLLWRPQGLFGRA